MKDGVIYKSLGNTFIYIFFLIVLNFILPYIIAYILAHLITKMKSVYRVMILFSEYNFISSRIVDIFMGFQSYGRTDIKIYELFGVESPFWLKTNGLVIHFSNFNNCLEDIWI